MRADALVKDESERAGAKLCMSYLVYIDGREAWCASSLRSAQLLAEGFICDLKKLAVVTSKGSEWERTWVYDYRQLKWVEQDGDAAQPG